MNFGNRRFQRSPRGKPSSPSSSRPRRRTTRSEARRGSEVLAFPRSSPDPAAGGSALMCDASETADFLRVFALGGDTFAWLVGEGLSFGRSECSACAVSSVVSTSIMRTGKIRGSAGSDWEEGLASLRFSKTAEAAARGGFGIEPTTGAGSLAAISLAGIIDRPNAFRALRLYSTTKGFVGRFMESVQVRRSFSISTGQSGDESILPNRVPVASQIRHAARSTRHRDWAFGAFRDSWAPEVRAAECAGRIRSRWSSTSRG